MSSVDSELSKPYNFFLCFFLVLLSDFSAFFFLSSRFLLRFFLFLLYFSLLLLLFVFQRGLKYTADSSHNRYTFGIQKRQILCEEMTPFERSKVSQTLHFVVFFKLSVFLPVQKFCRLRFKHMYALLHLQKSSCLVCLLRLIV